MQPRIPTLAQSENKSRFLERLGISDRTEDGKKLYAMMKVHSLRLVIARPPDHTNAVHDRKRPLRDEHA